MNRVDQADTVPVLPAPTSPGPAPNSYYQGGDIIIGQPGTVVQAEHLNMFQEELSNIVEKAGITLSKSSRTQISNLIQGKAANVASAATVNLGNVEGRFVDITGTTTITSFGTPANGGNTTSRLIRFTGILTITESANIILPGGEDILTEAGDIAEFFHLGAGVWTCIRYQRASGGETAKVGFYAFQTSNQSLPTSETTALVLDDVEFDTHGYYNTSTYEFTPEVKGKYLFIHGMSISGSGFGAFDTFIYKNGVQELKYTSVNYGSGGIAGSAILDMNGTTDKVKIYAFPSLLTGVSTDSPSTFFAGWKIG